MTYTPQPPPLAGLGHSLETITRLWAMFGGFVLMAIMVIESASVIGRGLAATGVGSALGIKGIAGDTEIVEVGCAIAIFSFLPYCQIMRGNVLVDFFTKGFVLRVRSLLDLVANLLFLAIALAIAVQLGHATRERWENWDTTTVLRIPESLPYSLSLVSAWLLVIAILFSALRSFNEIRTGRAIGPQPSGEH